MDSARCPTTFPFPLRSGKMGLGVSFRGHPLSVSRCAASSENDSRLHFRNTARSYPIHRLIRHSCSAVHRPDSRFGEPRRVSKRQPRGACYGAVARTVYFERWRQIERPLVLESCGLREIQQFPAAEQCVDVPSPAAPLHRACRRLLRHCASEVVADHQKAVRPNQPGASGKTRCGAGACTKDSMVHARSARSTLGWNLTVVALDARHAVR